MTKEEFIQQLQSYLSEDKSGFELHIEKQTYEEYIDIRRKVETIQTRFGETYKWVYYMDWLMEDFTPEELKSYMEDIPNYEGENDEYMELSFVLKRFFKMYENEKK